MGTSKHERIMKKGRLEAEQVFEAGGEKALKKMVLELVTQVRNHTYFARLERRAFFRLRRQRERRLADVNVQLYDPTPPTLKCLKCGRKWTPKTLPVKQGGIPTYRRLPRDYWKCPKGCNANV